MKGVLPFAIVLLAAVSIGEILSLSGDNRDLRQQKQKLLDANTELIAANATLQAADDRLKKADAELTEAAANLKRNCELLRETVRIKMGWR